MSGSSIPLTHPEIFHGLEGITAAFTTRNGGVSDPPYDSLNLGMSTGDQGENVRENRKRLLAELGFDDSQLTLAGQIHEDNLKAVVSPGLYKGYDALVTRTKGLLLGITAADCAAVLLADPKAGIVAACHAGWRGVVARLTVKTVTAMTRAGAVPDRILAYVSPSISVEKFEVGEEVAGEFKRKFVERRDEWERPHVDLKGALGEQLKQAGVPENQTEISTQCTASDTGQFYSYREENGVTGRMMGVIGLTSSV